MGSLSLNTESRSTDEENVKEPTVEFITTRSLDDVIVGRPPGPGTAPGVILAETVTGVPPDASICPGLGPLLWMAAMVTSDYGARASGCVTRDATSLYETTARNSPKKLRAGGGTQEINAYRSPGQIKLGGV